MNNDSGFTKQICPVCGDILISNTGEVELPCNDCRLNPFEKQLKTEIQELAGSPHYRHSLYDAVKILGAKYGLDYVTIYHWTKGYKAGTFPEVKEIPPEEVDKMWDFIDDRMEEIYGNADFSKSMANNAKRQRDN